MLEKPVAEISPVTSAPALDAPFGFSETFRKVVTTGLLAMSGFITGCAKSLDERCLEFDSLPRATVNQVADSSLRYQAREVAIHGRAHLIADRSYSTSSIVLMPISTGKTTMLVPTTVTSRHPHFDYTITEEGDQPRTINAHSTFVVPEGAVKMKGSVKDYGKGFVFEITDAMSQQEYAQGHRTNSAE